MNLQIAYFITIAFNFESGGHLSTLQADTNYQPVPLEINGVLFPAQKNIFLNTFGKPDSITTVENEIGWLTEKDDSIQILLVSWELFFYLQK